MFDANIINRRTNPLVLTYNSWTFLKNVLFKNSLAMKFFFCLIWMIWFRHFRGDLLVCEKIFEEMINCNLQYLTLQLILPWSFIFHVLVSSSKSSSPPSPLVYETPYLFYVTIFISFDIFLLTRQSSTDFFSHITQLSKSTISISLLQSKGMQNKKENE